MGSTRDKVRALAEIMAEFGLEHAKWKSGGVTVELGRAAPTRVAAPQAVLAGPDEPAPPWLDEEAEPARGTPVESPTTGVFYTAPSPGSPPFVKVGDPVEAGQIVGLIEAMKVFNEVASPVSGIVLATPAQNGDLVNPGDPLVLVDEGQEA